MTGLGGGKALRLEAGEGVEGMECRGEAAAETVADGTVASTMADMACWRLRWTRGRLRTTPVFTCTRPPRSDPSPFDRGSEER